MNLDKTFCAAEDCQNTECPKFLSDKVVELSDKLEVLIKVKDYSRSCDDYIEGSL